MTPLPSFDELLATAPDDEQDDPRHILIDWAEFWTVDHSHAEWLVEPIIAAGRSHALFAPGGTGKSLMALWMAARAATGYMGFSSARREPIDVLYLDYEMTTADLSERLESMGYGPETDLSHLHYALLPAIAPLDEPEGGKAVIELAQATNATLVVIDTFSRAVHGDENDADTVRSWYRWTGLHLKAEGRAFVRVDHAGKDLDRGQRGSSAKNDDVDVVWRMTKGDGDAFALKAVKRRMGWVPDEVKVMRHDDPLRYSLVDGFVYPAGTSDMVATLIALGVPSSASTRDATNALKAADKGARRAVVVAAMRHRRESIEMSMSTREPLAEPPLSTGLGTTDREFTEPQVDGSGTTGNHYRSPNGNHGTPLKGVPVPGPDPAAPTHPF